MVTTLEFWVWIATALLFVLYGVAGVMKTFFPIPRQRLGGNGWSAMAYAYEGRSSRAFRRCRRTAESGLPGE